MDVSDKVVEPGQNITYTLNATLKAPRPGTGEGKSNLVSASIVLTPDANAPFDTPQLSSGDFKWSDGRRRTIVGVEDSDDGRSKMYIFDLGSERATGNPLTVTANIPATVSTKVTPGTEIKAEANAATEIDPETSWSAPDPQYRNVNSETCTAEFYGTATFHGGGYGAWLAEIKLATLYSSSVLDPNGPNLKITTPDGSDITQEVLAASEFKAKDNSDPVDPNAKGNNNFKYQQSHNFPLDVDTLTGKVWIPDGTKIEYSQTVKHEGCLPGRDTYWNQESYGFTVVTAKPTHYAEQPMEAVSVVQKDDPKFAVEKALSAGESSAVELKSGESEVAWTYDVTVSNIGDVDGKSAPVFDTPEVPAGFRVKSVEVDGRDVTDTEDAGKYTVSGDGVELAAGADPKVFKVKVTYEVDQDAVTKADGWQDLGQCQAATDGQKADPSKGVYNLVTMDGDLDEPGVVNNDECVTVTKKDDPPE